MFACNSVSRILKNSVFLSVKSVFLERFEVEQTATVPQRVAYRSALKHTCRNLKLSTRTWSFSNVPHHLEMREQMVSMHCFLRLPKQRENTLYDVKNTALSRKINRNREKTLQRSTATVVLYHRNLKNNKNVEKCKNHLMYFFIFLKEFWRFIFFCQKIQNSNIQKFKH